MIILLALVAFPCMAGPPTIGVIPDQVIAENGRTPALPIIVNVSSYTLKGWSSDPLLFPATNIVFGGSGSKPTVTVIAAPNRFGQANVTIDAEGSGQGSIVTFLVTVTAKLQIQRLRGQVTLNWTATNAVVQTSTELDQGWSDLFDAVSPYAVPPGKNQYFKLRPQ